MFALVDCNNFYVSCERVFNPSLNGKPVVVLSNNDGCVISRSNEAKALGIKMGEPAFKIEPFLKRYNVIVFSSNYILYGDMSQRVMNTLAQFSPDIEIYSIDEAFLSLGGFEFFNIDEYARNIREITTKNTGIPVSVGVAQTKTLAKVANHFGKKHSEYKGVCIINSDKKRIALLKQFKIVDVWGIGRQYAKFLIQFGINTAYDLTQAPEKWVKQNLSVTGLRTQQELLGISCVQMDLSTPAKKAICNARSFGKMQTKLPIITEAVSNFASRCAYKLRKQKACANIIMVFIHTNQYRQDLKQYASSKVISLPVATNSTIEIVHYANTALKSIFKEGYLYKKAGVIVSGIVSETGLQTALFDTTDRKKHKKIMNAVDTLNSYYGKDKVMLAAQGNKIQWKLRQEKLSPCYTTNWNDTIIVKI
ncbi:MAG: SOS mutagenesis and repair protein UmuC [Bacteroidetes bacterium CG23_combo_of_CG06-09_8_20_14_all_32_9]|nr:MAG: SOS mutagenesis and repair protein UmuC [Bacteroidetes bacterium CG23_combo_of_CG06-09_8_20_14_all_32_9]